MLIAQTTNNVAVESVITSYNAGRAALVSIFGEWGTVILGAVIVGAVIWKLMAKTNL